MIFKAGRAPHYFYYCSLCYQTMCTEIIIASSFSPTSATIIIIIIILHNISSSSSFYVGGSSAISLPFTHRLFPIFENFLAHFHRKLFPLSRLLFCCGILYLKAIRPGGETKAGGKIPAFSSARNGHVSITHTR